MGKDIRVVSMDAEAIAVIKKNIICMIMSMYTGHKMISGNKRTRKQVKNTEEEES